MELYLSIYLFIYFLPEKLQETKKSTVPRPLLPEKSIWSKKLKKYSGVIGTKFFRGPGRSVIILFFPFLSFDIFV